MKLVFFMRHRGYVRNFEAALGALAERGHDVHLAFETDRTPWLKGRDPSAALRARYPNVTTGPAPELAWPTWARLAAMFQALIDYLRYLEPLYADAPKLRARAEKNVVPPLRALPRLPLFRGAAGRERLRRLVTRLIELVPADPALEAYLRDERPDVVLVTPLVGIGSTQPAVLAAAHRRGIPGVLCVASWDNLTNKGLISNHPDLVTVWNEAQRTEAIELHRVAPERVVATGAHTYDHWFAWKPSRDRAALCAETGLDPDRPYILYLGSSPFVAPDEDRHVASWIRALRESGHDVLRDAGVLVRPHPQNKSLWESAELAALPNVAIWPGAGADPVDEQSRSDFFDSIHHAAAVVGVNTSAQIESAIVDRPVFTVLADQFADTQGGTLHFEHIAGERGLVRVAPDMATHAAQLAEALAGDGLDADRRRAFLEHFVRPGGLDLPAAPRLADALEDAAALQPAARPAPRLGAALLAPAALALRLASAKRPAPRRLAGRAAGAVLALVARRPVPKHRPTRRVLFYLNYPGYLRYFDVVIRELAARGHEVLLVFDRPDKQAEGLSAIEGIDGVRVVGRTPRRADSWAVFARGLRGATDYARYLDPAFRDAGYLRDRRRKALTLAPAWLRPLGRLKGLPGLPARALVASLRAMESAIPSDPAVEASIAEHRPDIVVVTPLVTEASPQTDIVKSARALGIPTALCVASWDHLTTKGLMRVVPDRVVMWNGTQAREAFLLHDVPPERIAVTGAQPFDRWFGRQPSSDREAFCAKVGLPADRPFVLFMGSTAGISRPEAEEQFVRAWIAAIRSSDDPVLRDVGVLVRPHPYNPGTWATADLSGLGPVAVWPRAGVNIVDESNRDDYFDSMHHSAAVVGINTSAMIESAIVGRTVLTVRDETFARTQDGTLHFHYLLPEKGGFLRVARSLDEHVAQLAATLADPAAARAETERFVREFVRPHGLDRPCAPMVADELEQLALPVRHRPAGVPLRLRPLSWLLRPVAAQHRWSDPRLLARDVRQASTTTDQRLRRAADDVEAFGIGGQPLRRAGRAARRNGKRFETRLRERSADGVTPLVPEDAEAATVVAAVIAAKEAVAGIEEDV